MTRTDASTDDSGQPVGEPVDWTPPAPLTAVPLSGRWVDLEPLTPVHADDLYAATCGDGRAASWTYLADEMPASPAEARAYVERRVTDPRAASLAIRPRGRGVEGVASWLRQDPANGSVEVGSIGLGPMLQRSTAATEAMWLMAAHAFGAGYRRYEWKCDALNAPSRRAAARLGFRYEGTFRQAVVYKGRNRDTAWYSLTDGEWRALAPAYAAWLDPANFEDPERGLGQRTSLSVLVGDRLATWRDGVPTCRDA
ncbi:MAG: GNAT family N-acetyltransferase [Nocardioidaceae bacterium]|nr:GNAT family N-acetyltransferase [Nocardioidaceae bacterium]